MNERSYDVVIVGSGAGGGTVAKELSALAQEGLRVLVVEQGPRFRDEDFTGRELEMAGALYQDGGGFLTADGTMTLAFGSAYGGSTVVYTGTSLVASERVVRRWGVPGLSHGDVESRSYKYAAENNVHLLPSDLLNENNRLFLKGAEGAGFQALPFPVNVKGCVGSSLCNLGCAHGAKQGTHRVQLPRAERNGVEVVTRAAAVRIGHRALHVRVSDRPPGGKGALSEWPPGDYWVRAGIIVLAAGAVGSPALLLRSGLPVWLPRLGQGFTCHPAQILLGEHAREISNDVGHPKSYYVDRAQEEGYVLETCMYFPFMTAKSLTGFGPESSALLRRFPRLQMILVLACDRALRQNRVTVDRHGRPSVHYAFTPKVVRSLARANRAAARILFAAGAVRVHAPLADPPLLDLRDVHRLDEKIHDSHFKPGKQTVTAAHLMGGCGMGRSPADSVTDVWGRLHGIPWIRVADASLFPDSLEINPYLTIMALADRVAEKIREEAPWLLASREHRRAV